MTLQILVLFLTPMLAGLLIYLIPYGKGSTNFKLLLVFAGAYLFAITVIHILPEVFVQANGNGWVSVFVLVGFFLQQGLEYFSSGIEHGHIHAYETNHEHHHHSSASAIVLLSALCVHAFLEGGILVQVDNAIGWNDRNAILIGIVLHRAPAAFALMAVLSVQLHSRKKSIPYLVIFSLAAPAGLMISAYLTHQQVWSEAGLLYLYALVSGNFLHISTTIVFESSPDHHFNARKLLIAVVGAMVAVGVEYFV
jgi:zinc transporter ZupT